MRINFAQSKTFLGNITHRQVILPVAKFHLLFNDTAGDIDLFFIKCVSADQNQLFYIKVYHITILTDPEKS